MPHPGLIEWVAKQHKGQLIKGTNEPYLNHLLRLGEMAGEFTALGLECGLCHDLFEKTVATPQILKYHLRRSGYVETAADLIVAVVIELTGVYIKASYPDLKKPERKEREDYRLVTISSTAQTVKYADLYDNCLWMAQHDPGKTLKYLKRKKVLVQQMNSGDKTLKQKLLDLIATIVKNFNI